MAAPARTTTRDRSRRHLSAVGRTASGLLVGVAVLAGNVACSSRSDPAGPVPLRLKDDSSALGAVVSGELARTEDGCWTLLMPQSAPSLVAWPAGTTPVGEHAVRLRDGTRLDEGQLITGGGGSVPVESLDRSAVDDSAGCLARTSLRSVTPIHDPRGRDASSA